MLTASINDNRTPAIFLFQLQADNTVSHSGTLALHGNPLDVVVFGSLAQSLLVAIDVPDSDGEILVFERDEKAWAPRQPVRGVANSTDEHSLLSRDDLDKVLYTVENLRKTGNDGGGDEDAPEQNPEIRE